MIPIGHYCSKIFWLILLFAHGILHCIFCFPFLHVSNSKLDAFPKHKVFYTFTFQLYDTALSMVLLPKIFLSYYTISCPFLILTGISSSFPMLTSQPVFTDPLFLFPSFHLHSSTNSSSLPSGTNKSSLDSNQSN